MAKNDVEKRVSAVERAQTHINQMVQDIEQSLNQQTPEEAIASMAMPIFEAESFADMFNQVSNVNPRADLMDVGLRVDTVTWNRSDYSEGLPFYATFHGVVLEGPQKDQEYVTNCGSWQAVTVAWNCQKKGWLPKNFVFHQSEKATSRGFHPVNLLPWGDYEEAF